MKLMKFLVVALVAGSVFAPVASQAGEVDGKAIICKHQQYRQGNVELANNLSSPLLIDYTVEEKRQGLNLEAYVFGYDITTLTRRFPRSVRVHLIINPDSAVKARSLSYPYDEFEGPKYKASLTHIEWQSYGKVDLSLNRNTLVLTDKVSLLFKKRGVQTITRSAQCSLIEPHKIQAAFQPYIDYGNAADDKIRESNKL